MNRVLFCCFQLLCGLGLATDYQPWLGNAFEFESRASFYYEHFSCLHGSRSGSRSISYPSRNGFATLSLANAFPPGFGIECAVQEAWTHAQKGTIDHLKLNGRYLYWNQLEGDPFHFLIGCSLIQAFKDSVKDPSSFHHGRREGEFFVSIGRERFEGMEWTNRYWGLAALGLANRGSPWLRGKLCWEYRFTPKHQMDLFCQALCGAGQQPLFVKHFKGYGSVKHRSIDAGLAYTYWIDFFGSVRFAYSTRLFARNFPNRAHQFLFEIFYTFGP